MRDLKASEVLAVVKRFRLTKCDLERKVALANEEGYMDEKAINAVEALLVILQMVEGE